MYYTITQHRLKEIQYLNHNFKKKTKKKNVCKINNFGSKKLKTWSSDRKV